MIGLAQKFLVVAAGLFGASGIILSAVTAHIEPSPALQNASLILLVHAPALIAGLSLVRSGIMPRFGGMLGLLVLALGVLLFSGDLSLRSFVGAPLFPLAAPSGGILLVAGWVILALSEIFLRKSA